MADDETLAVEQRAVRRLNDAGIHIDAAVELLCAIRADVGSWRPDNRLDALIRQFDVIGLAVAGLRYQVSESIELRQQRSVAEQEA